MLVLRHAALHAQEQHIVWQQMFIESKEYVLRPTKVKLPAPQKANPSKLKNKCSYCGFFVVVARLGGTGLDGVAGVLVSSVADWMISSLGKPLSR
jgi:hypothetical protein